MRTRNQIFLAFGLSVGIIAALAGVKYLQISKAIAESSKFAPPPPAVNTYTAEEQVWARQYQAVGTLRPVKGVTLASEAEGRVAKILFENGSHVNAGQVLLELDISVEEAELKGAQARLEQSEKALAREQALREKNASSIENLENAESSFRQNKAAVESLKAAIARRKIIAPFSGTAGIRQVNVGDYVSTGKEIVSLQSVHELYLDLTAPQQLLPQISLQRPVEVRVDAFPGKVFSARVSALAPEVDAVTRNFSIQATVANADEQLRPGMFVEATIILPHSDTYVVVPATAIQYAPYGDAAFVLERIDPENPPIARQQVVQLGPKRGDFIAIRSGIEKGAEVVSSGLFKVRPGQPVTIANSVQPELSQKPQPQDS